ncbi:MAG: MnhB domain-containing protein [Burkholderiaceae bacterium]|nr:MnhB domain-containing protein [Burkholderiaceae bacterium]
MKRRLVILEVVAPPLYWMILAGSIWVLFTGHNEPGGGFIGGLLAVSASVLWAVAYGSRAAERRLPLGDAIRLAALGVGMAAVSGLHALFGGDSFLTHAWGTLPLGFMDLTLSTVMMFDFGVYLSVWGGLAGYSLGLLGLEEAGEGSE